MYSTHIVVPRDDVNLRVPVGLALEVDIIVLFDVSEVEFGAQLEIQRWRICNTKNN